MTTQTDPEAPAGTTAGALGPSPIELSGVVLEAYLLHIEEVIRAEVTAEIDAAEAASWEPIRRHLERTRNIPGYWELKARDYQHLTSAEKRSIA